MKKKEYSVSIRSIIEEFQLETIYLPEKEVLVTRSDVNRPGLALSGFFVYFEPARIQVIGNMEHEYLKSLKDSDRKTHIYKFMAEKPVAIIYTTSLEVYPEMLEYAKVFEIPILRTSQHTSAFMSALIASLTLSLAPRIIRHGVFVEVYGEGILITGDSGIGKSETAIELLKRGHRLIADDAVEIKRASAKTLVGSAPSNIRYYAELRGIGIIDVRRIFGMGAVKDVEKIDFVINLEKYSEDKIYDRMGLETEYTDIMGIKIPIVNIPVLPGRNLAIIIEIAAMNHRQKKMGYNAAVEFNNKINAIFNNN